MPAGIRFEVIFKYIDRRWAAFFAVALLFTFGVRLAVVLEGYAASPPDNTSPKQYTYIAPDLAFKRDAATYDEMARDFLAGRGLVHGEKYQYKASIPPLYPLFLACVYAVFGRSALTVGLAHVLLGVGTCAIVGLIVKRYLGAAVGLLAMIGTAVEPQLLKWTAHVCTDTLMVFLVGLVVLAHLWTAQKKCVWPAAVAGLSIAFATLCRQAILPFALFGGIWLAFQWSRSAGSVLRNGTAYVVALTLGLSPLWVGNWLEQGTPTLLTSKAATIPVGNNSARAKTIWEDPPRMEIGYRGFGQGFEKGGRRQPWQSEESGPKQVTIHQKSETTLLEFVLNNPLRYSELCLSRIMYLWNLWPTPPPSIIFFVAYWIFLGMALIGGVVYWRRSGLVQIAVLLTLSYTLVHGATWAIPRYRLPVVPWVIVLAIIGGLALVGAGVGLCSNPPVDRGGQPPNRSMEGSV